MKKTNATNRISATNTSVESCRDLSPIFPAVAVLGLILMILSGIDAAVMAHGCGNSVLWLGYFSWAVMPAGAFLCVTTFRIPVFRFLRRHPIALYGLISILPIASIVYYSMADPDVGRIYLSVMTYCASTMFAFGAYLVDFMTTDTNCCHDTSR